MFNKTLFEQGINIIPDVAPVDFDADQAGDYVNLANVDRAYFCLYCAAGSSGTMHIDMNQAQDASGTGVKALTFSRYYYKVADNLSTVGQFTEVELDTAVSDLDLDGTDVQDDQFMIVIEIPADSLDVNGGFTHVQQQNEGDNLGAARLCASWWILTGDAYAKSVPNSAIA